MKMLLIFIACTLLNVVLSTIKSVMTIKGTKFSAAFWSALSYGLYAYIVILTATADLSTLVKVIVTVGCNLLGVYAVKLVEQKMRKDRLWKIEITVNAENAAILHERFEDARLSHNYFITDKYAIFNCFTKTKKETKNCTSIAKEYNGKFFASETKLTP